MRFRARSVHKSIADWVEAQMDTDGWNVPNAIATTAFTFVQFQPEEETTSVSPNTVAITLGDIDEDNLEQLGGDLWTQDLVCYIDIYGENTSVTLSVVDDLMQALQGDNPYIPVYDYTTDVPTLTDLTLEVVKPIARRPPQAGSSDYNKFWRVIAFRGELTHG